MALEKTFKSFSYGKSMGAKYNWVWPILTTWGMVGRIYEGGH